MEELKQLQNTLVQILKCERRLSQAETIVQYIYWKIHFLQNVRELPAKCTQCKPALFQKILQNQRISQMHQQAETSHSRPSEILRKGSATETERADLNKYNIDSF
ncbi:Hypothetical_protein [Hexamita inflata]|uniref:Hypothetical_protein n=1 Tax=Hexamita inflata TaxID=28002 RepID=A0ABP1GG20_9EUKA